MKRVRNILILAGIANYQELGLSILVIRVWIAERGLLQFVLTVITSQIGTCRDLISLSPITIQA
jgi:hypothetical protein